jgi:hypothetical protein
MVGPGRNSSSNSTPNCVGGSRKPPYKEICYRQTTPTWGGLFSFFFPQLLVLSDDICYDDMVEKRKRGVLHGKTLRGLYEDEA